MDYKVPNSWVILDKSGLLTVNPSNGKIGSPVALSNYITKYDEYHVIVLQDLYFYLYSISTDRSFLSGKIFQYSAPQGISV